MDGAETRNDQGKDGAENDSAVKQTTITLDEIMDGATDEKDGLGDQNESDKEEEENEDDEESNDRYHEIFFNEIRRKE